MGSETLPSTGYIHSDESSIPFYSTVVAGIKRLLSRTHAYIHKQSERAYGDQPASEASSNALFKHTTLLLCLLETK